MSDTATLADHIDQQVDAILGVWKSTVERYGNVPDSERLSYREFVDHIPELLDRLADRLRGRDVDPDDVRPEARPAPLEPGLRHRRGRQRARAPPHDLDERLLRVRRGSMVPTWTGSSRRRSRSTRSSTRRPPSRSASSTRTARSLSQGMLDAFEERKIAAEVGEDQAPDDAEQPPGRGLGRRMPTGRSPTSTARPSGSRGSAKSETVGRVNILRGYPGISALPAGRTGVRFRRPAPLAGPPGRDDRPGRLHLADEVRHSWSSPPTPRR